MKIQPWPYCEIEDVRSRLLDYGLYRAFDPFSYNIECYKFKDGEMSDYEFILEPLFHNVLLAIHHQGKPLFTSDILDHPSEHPNEISDICIFFLDVLQ